MRYYLNSGLFLTTILCFLLPFMEIRCNDSALGHMTGYDLATKGEFRMNASAMSEYMQGDEYEALKKQQKGPDPFTITSFILLLCGGALQFILKKKRELLAIICAIAASVVLIVMQIIYQNEWDKQMEGAVELASFSYMKFTLHFVYGYLLAVILPFIIAGINFVFMYNDRRAAAIVPYDPDLFREEGEPEETSL